MSEEGVSARPAKYVPWVAVLVAGVVSIAPLVPPSGPPEPDPTAFSAARAIQHVERIATEPRPIGSPANRQARADIVDELEELGLEPNSQTIEAYDYYSGSADTVAIVNVLARIPGTASTGTVALVGHYDTVPTTPGANDDASAVAVLLETARAILAGPPLRNDVVLLFTDGEEPAPRFGSSAFVSQHPSADDVAFVLNLEAIGTTGPSTPIELNGPEAWIIDLYAEAAPYPAAFSYLTATSKLIGGSNTDFAPFRDNGVSGLDMAYLHGSPVYHSPADAPDRVSLRSLHQHGSNTLALARRIADLDLRLSPTDTEAVFFTIGRFWVVRYPAAASLPIVFLAGVALAAAIRRKWRRILQSVGTTALRAFAAALVVVAIWTVLAGWRDTMGVVESYLYLVGLVVVIIATGLGTGRMMNKRTRSDSDGVVTSWWLMALLISLLAPGIGYLFMWPALAGGLALLLQRPDKGHGRRELVGFVVVAWITLVLLVPAIDTFYQLAQPRPGNTDSQILAIIAIPAVLISLVVELLRTFHAGVAGSPTDGR